MNDIMPSWTIKRDKFDNPFALRWIISYVWMKNYIGVVGSAFHLPSCDSIGTPTQAVCGT